ncbi:uncharacterized protein [Temnothorax nylanderi]|uniref:uncharacterized protein n=1 Tax=Temnothorax nylanderi TaxID=102681 RepID=UPI003A8733CB
MPPKMKSLSTDVEMKMIQEIETRPVLWDVTSSIYKRADLKPAAWAEVADALKIPSITAEIVAKRWKNMKETFMKNLAKVKECKNKNSGNGADDGFKPTWYLYKRLLFLMKTCAQAESKSNLPSPPLSAICSDTDLAFHSIYYDENVQKFMMLPEDTSNATNSNESLGSSCDGPLLVSPGPSSDPAGIIISPLSVPTPPPRPASAPINNGTTAKRPCEEDHFLIKEVLVRRHQRRSLRAL